MGLSFFLFNLDNPDGYMVESKLGLGDLPQSCVASILGYLEPAEICKLAKLNRAFRGTSMADFVWESKLPSNYNVLVRKVLGDSLGNLGKGQIFFFFNFCPLNFAEPSDNGGWCNPPCPHFNLAEQMVLKITEPMFLKITGCLPISRYIGVC